MIYNSDDFLNTRQYRILGGTEDEDEFARRHGNAIGSGYELPPVLVPVSQVAAYRKERYIAYDLTVSQYRRKYPSNHRDSNALWLANRLGSRKITRFDLPKE